MNLVQAHAQAERWIKADKKADERFVREIAKRLNQMADDIEQALMTYYAQYPADIAEAKRPASMEDIQRTRRLLAELKDLTENAEQQKQLVTLTYQFDRLQNLTANIATSTIKAYSDIETMMQEELTERVAEEFERDAQMLDISVAEASGQVGESFTFLLEVALLIALNPFKGATFKDRLWSTHTEMTNTIYSRLTNALTQGHSVKDAVKAVKEVIEKVKKNVGRLFVSDSTRAETEADKKAMENAGEEYYLYHAEINCCPVCATLAGRIFKVSEMEIGVNAPLMHPNCRCKIIMNPELKY